MSLLTDKGSVSFNSGYQLRLFQVIPILDELDHERAQSLLRENNEAQSMLAQYPQGMQSLDPGMLQKNPVDPAKRGIKGVMFRLGSGSPQQSLDERVQDQIREQLNMISTEASKDPKQALADALNLPASNANGPPAFLSPRAIALLNVANSTVEQNPGIARSALDELRKNLEPLQPFERGRNLSEATRLYIKLGEMESAKKTLQELAKVVDQVYQQDTDANDPNQAFKAQWPSTALWLSTMKLSARISPELAEQVTASIPDPEIAGAVRVAYADALTGAPESTSEVARWHKNGQTILRF